MPQLVKACNQSPAKYLAEQRERIDTFLDAHMPVPPEAHGLLFEAARYSLLGSGKRLRPILTLAVAEMMGGSEAVALAQACAIELTHTYSLIHDDLPCMDDDDFRRGKPTLHKVSSEAIAVLAGDFLLTQAFALITQASGLSAEVKVKLIETLSTGAGGEGMIGGQILDIEAEGKRISLKDLEEIHQRKTGALLSTAIVFGGIIAEAPREELEILRRFGDLLGLAFQIVDDVLDVTGNEEALGKDVGSDHSNGKTTYATLLGVKEAKERACALYEEAIALLDALPYETSRLKQLAETLVQRVH